MDYCLLGRCFYLGHDSTDGWWSAVQHLAVAAVVAAGGPLRSELAEQSRVVGYGRGASSGNGTELRR